MAAEKLLAFGLKTKIALSKVNLLRLSENSIRDREVGNYLFLTHARIQRGLGGPDPPPPKKKITRYIGFYRNKDLQPPPPPPQKKKKLHPR